MAAYGPGSYGSGSYAIKRKKGVGYVPTSAYGQHTDKPPTWAAPTQAGPPLKAWDVKPPDPTHDSGYNAAAAGADASKKSADASYDYGLTSGQSAYGLSATQGADGNWTIAEIDPTSPLYDPFSKMALLRTHFEQGQRGNTNSYAAQGQLYAGSLQNAQNETGRQFNQGVDENNRSFQDYLHRNVGTKDAAYGAADASVTQAGGDEIARHINDPAPVQDFAQDQLPPGVEAPGVKLAPGWKVRVQDNKVIGWVDPQGNFHGPKPGGGGIY